MTLSLEMLAKQSNHSGLILFRNKIGLCLALIASCALGLPSEWQNTHRAGITYAGGVDLVYIYTKVRTVRIECSTDMMTWDTIADVIVPYAGRQIILVDIPEGDSIFLRVANSGYAFTYGFCRDWATSSTNKLFITCRWRNSWDNWVY